MGHNITTRDGMFTVREPAWHGLGTTLRDYPTREEAQAIAHPWEPVREPVFRQVPIIRPHVHTTACVVGECDLQDDLTTEYEQVEGFSLNARSDDGYPLGVTPTSLELVTNGELYDIAEAIEGEARGSVMFETGGSLKGGRKVWLLIRLRDPIRVGNDTSATIPYFGLQNSHDGNGALRGQATLVRVVCDNTAQAADLDSRMRGTEFTFRHTRNVRDRIEQAKEALAGWRDSIDDWRVWSAHLQSLKVSSMKREEFIERYIPLPPPAVTSERVRENVRIAQGELRTILAGPTCVGIEDTAYGLVQASIEYLNHARAARSKESRFKRAYLDRNTMASTASALALEVALS